MTLVVDTMVKVPSLTSISPSSTMEVLPTSKPPLHRTRSTGKHHTLEVGGDGTVKSCAHGGASMLMEEGEEFVGQLTTLATREDSGA